MRARRPLVVALAVVALASATSVARSHTGGSTGYASIAIDGPTVRYSLTLWPAALPPDVTEGLRLAGADRPDSGEALLALLREKLTITADAARCAAGRGQLAPATPDVKSVTAIVDFTCPPHARALVIRDDTFDTLGGDHHTLGRIEAGGQTRQFALEPAARETTVTLGGTAAGHGGMGSFLALGVHHILSGWDHLLFLLALLLRGGRLLSLLRIVTAFTAAHSITLAMAVLGVVTVPDRLVESVIAASIAYIALENLVARDAVSRRWLVSFAFGLVHGLGFASALGPLELPRESLAVTLLAFNLGVELGQAAVIVVALPVLVWLRQRAWEGSLVRAASAALVVVGVALCVQRLLA